MLLARLGRRAYLAAAAGFWLIVQSTADVSLAWPPSIVSELGVSPMEAALNAAKYLDKPMPPGIGGLLVESSESGGASQDSRAGIEPLALKSCLAGAVTELAPHVEQLVDIITAGERGEVKVSSLSVGPYGSKASLALLIAGARHVSGATYDAAWVVLRAHAQTVPLHTVVHKGCCDWTCNIGNCGTWIHSGCDGCDEELPRGPTVEELQEIEEALGVVAYRSLRPPRGVAAKISPRSPAVRAPLSDLVRALQSWLRSPATRQAIQAPGTGMVERLKVELTSLSEQADAFNVDGVLKEDVLPFLQDVLSPPWNSSWVQAVACMVSGTNTDDWRSTSAASSNATHLLYSTILWALDWSRSSYHVVACNLDTEFQGDEVDVVMNTTFFAQGSASSTARISHSALSANDTLRVLTQLQYVCDSNILQLLKGSPGKPSFFTKYHRYLLPAEAHGPGDGALQGMRDIISNTQALKDDIAHAIGGFLHSSSQSVSFISRAGEFSRYSSSTNSYVLQGVISENLRNAMHDIITIDVPSAPPSMLKHLEILIYGTKNQSGWTGHLVHFNQTTGGQATTAMAFHTARDDGLHDLAVCTVAATFQVLGDLEVITTKQSYFGGLISGGSSVEIHKMPPAWTANDTAALNNFMNLECLNDISQTWTGQGPVILPDVPPVEALFI